MAGLQRRHDRVVKGLKLAKVPRTEEAAKEALRRAALLFAEVDTEDDAAYKTADEFLLRAALAVGIFYGKVSRAYNQTYQYRWIRKHGQEAWNKKVAGYQAKYAAKKKLVDKPNR